MTEVLILCGFGSFLRRRGLIDVKVFFSKKTNSR